MFCMMVMISLMLMMITPMKMAISLAALSIMISTVSFQYSNSMFCSTAIVLSFSSGMMVLFCYTSMTSNFETKTNKVQPMMILPLTACMPVITKSYLEPSYVESVNNLMNSLTIPVSMMMVILAMKSINVSVFNPSKSMLTYY